MKVFFNKTWQLLKLPHWFYLIGIALFFYGIACFAWFKSIDVPVYHMDGAFQTASGLFRLLRGELPGRDFYPYLGIGPIALIYPTFLLAGANLCASVFASYVTVYAADILSMAILIHLLFKPKRFLVSVLSACALLSIPLLLIVPTSPFVGMVALPYWLEHMMYPGNSLRPLRGFIVYAAIGALYFFVFPEKNIRRKYIYYGVTIAITSLWSNDYAVLTVATLFLLAWVNFIKDSTTHFFKTTVYFTLISMASVLLMQWLVTGGHPLKLAIFNFSDVAKDQWWYFGVWLESARVFSPNEIVKILPAIQDKYAHYVLAVYLVALLICKHMRVELLLVLLIGVLSFLGGVIACVGGHIVDYYFDGYIFWSKLAILLLGLRLLTGLFFTVLAGRGKNVLLIINVFICTLLIAPPVFYANYFWTLTKQQRTDSAAVFYVPELGGYLDQTWKDYIDYIKAHQDKTVVEEYYGIWSAFVKKPSIWPVDSVIHALGGVRQTAETAVREKADMVVTSNRAASLEWFAWSQSINYWFYKTLLDSYTPTFYSPFTIVWEKDKPRESGNAIACNISDSKDRLSLESPAVGYYEVQLKTKIDKLKNNRYLIMFENNISFAGLEIGEVAISPFDENHTQLVYVSNPTSNNFGFTARPAGTVRVSIESCSARAVPFKNERVLLLSEGKEKMYGKHALDYVWDDPNFWDRGIATNRAGFLVYRDKQALADFKIGNIVELPNKETRIITALGGSAAYLEVYLNGAKLNPDTIGLPTAFKVISDEDELEKLAVSLGDEIFLTDNVEWVKGISLLGAQFIVPNTKKNRELFKPLNRIQIPNTTERLIGGVVPSGIYLRVYVDGAVLDSAVVGLPKHFKVIPNVQ